MSTVEIYSTPSCPWCHKAKDYFKEKGVIFTDYNVADDVAKGEEMVNKSGQMGVPVIVIDQEVIIGFDKVKIDQLLKL